MKRDNKKALYESIMASVAREVKKTINESFNPNGYTSKDLGNIRKKLDKIITLSNGNYQLLLEFLIFNCINPENLNEILEKLKQQVIEEC